MTIVRWKKQGGFEFENANSGDTGLVPVAVDNADIEAGTTIPYMLTEVVNPTTNSLLTRVSIAGANAPAIGLQGASGVVENGNLIVDSGGGQAVNSLYGAADPWAFIARMAQYSAFAYDVANINSDVSSLGGEFISGYPVSETILGFTFYGYAYAALDNINNQLVFSFKGTNISDIAEDGTDLLALVNDLTGGDFAIGDYASKFLPWISSTVQKYLSTNPDYSISFTGHSLGGMTAEYFT